MKLERVEDASDAIVLYGLLSVPTLNAPQSNESTFKLIECI